MHAGKPWRKTNNQTETQKGYKLSVVFFLKFKTGTDLLKSLKTAMDLLKSYIINS